MAATTSYKDTHISPLAYPVARLWKFTVTLIVCGPGARLSDVTDTDAGS